MRFARFPSAHCLSLHHVHSVIADIQFCVTRILRMATSASSAESYTDWKCIKCSRDELRLDVTLASGQSFRLESYCLWALSRFHLSELEYCVSSETKSCGFCRAMQCISAAYVGMQCPSIRPSITFVSCAKTNISSKFFYHWVATQF